MCTVVTICAACLHIQELRISRPWNILMISKDSHKRKLGLVMATPRLLESRKEIFTHYKDAFPV